MRKLCEGIVCIAASGLFLFILYDIAMRDGQFALSVLDFVLTASGKASLWLAQMAQQINIR